MPLSLSISPSLTASVGTVPAPGSPPTHTDVVEGILLHQRTLQLRGTTPSEAMSRDDHPATGKPAGEDYVSDADLVATYNYMHRLYSHHQNIDEVHLQELHNALDTQLAQRLDPLEEKRVRQHTELVGKIGGLEALVKLALDRLDKLSHQLQTQQDTLGAVAEDVRLQPRMATRAATMALNRNHVITKRDPITPVPNIGGRYPTEAVPALLSPSTWDEYIGRKNEDKLLFAKFYNPAATSQSAEAVVREALGLPDWL